MKTLFSLLSCLLFLYACSPTQRIQKVAKKNLLGSAALKTAHTGISIFEPSSGKYWYNHQADKYFVPASNVKMVTCYAALKYLGDSLKALRYEEQENNTVIVEATGDPSLLHPQFSYQPVLDLLKRKNHVLINTENWDEQSLGKGWSWDDYNDDYMTERSPMPVFGNTVNLKQENSSLPFNNVGSAAAKNKLVVTPSFFRDSVYEGETYGEQTDAFTIIRDKDANRFSIQPVEAVFKDKSIPFITNGFEATRKILRDSLKIDIRTSFYRMTRPRYLYSQATDSVLKMMMYRSDNFLAEQLLLMVSNETLGTMNDEKIITHILTTDLKDLPQPPRWVDGSGLSRYNLFSPADFVFILNKMQQELGMPRLKNIFAGANQGTLKNYYLKDSSFIYAKTGSMSGVLSLSGFLYTSKNKLLIFSILVNNYQASAADVRRSIEKFLQEVRQRN